jgi:hypothetical protein
MGTGLFFARGDSYDFFNTRSLCRGNDFYRYLAV